MQYKKLGLLFYTLILTTITQSQTKYENPDFVSPVDFPIYLSGNFGEIRSTHFHAGIDIKTQGVTGKQVHAVQNGYISRIKISTNSYGKTIYINHPDGYTTVYGHLNNFNTKIEKKVKSIQYENNEFEINYFPNPTEFPVKKGDLIGFSGNTGSSEGPHLHFEVRKTADQKPVNPLFFNFKIIDHIAPVFYNLVIYPLNNNSRVNNKHQVEVLKVKKHQNIYSLVDSNQIYLSGDIGFGIEIYDYLNGSRNRCGIYSLSVSVNNNLIYKQIMDQFSFSETSYVKSHIDYGEKIKSKKTIQKTFVAPNNKLSIYKEYKNRGIYTFNKDTSYQIVLKAKDAAGNESNLSFNALCQLSNNSTLAQDTLSGTLMHWEKENKFENEEIKIIIPENSLFDSIFFNYSSSKPTFKAYSNVHHIHTIYTPLNKSYSISIKTSELPAELKDKALIAELLDDKINSIGGEVINGYIVSEAKTFGDYVVVIDTINPEIKLLTNFDKLLDNKIKFLISDDLSGIKSYNGYIDNNWALFEYDQKNDLLFYTLDEDKIVKNTKHELELFVIDNRNNISTYYTSFNW